MKTGLPWLLAVVFGAAAFFFFQGGQKKASQLATAQAELTELDQLREENAELQKLSGQVAEIGKLREDHAELIRLRGEVRKYKDQAESLQAGLNQAQAQAQRAQSQAQAALSEAQSLKANTPPPTQGMTAEQQAAFKNRYGGSPAEQQAALACINNLRRIDGAKQQWALEKHMNAQNVPQPQDIAPYLGPGNALPQCPAGGTYTLNNVGTPPTCSIAGHALPTPQ